MDAAGVGEVKLPDNPWLGLAESQQRHVLESDEDFVQRHNSSARPKYRIQTSSLPEPFIGDPKSAKLILLGLNPGHDGSVEADHGRQEIKDAIFNNLHQRNRDYPFYALDPGFDKTADFGRTGVAKYWRKRTHRLQEATGLADAVLATRLFVIEWFPYPSENWFYSAEKFEREFERTKKPLCPSQDYSHQLALSFLDDPHVIVLGMRSKRYWVAVDKRFVCVPFLNSHQNTCITPGNMEPGLFGKIVNLMKEKCALRSG